MRKMVTLVSYLALPSTDRTEMMEEAERDPSPHRIADDTLACTL
jgi:hypothetical protein